MLAAACAFASPAFAGTSVLTKFSSGAVNIQTNLTVESNVQTLWATLTDFNQRARFGAWMTLQRAVSSPGARPKLVDPECIRGLLSLIPDHVALASDEQSHGRIGFRSLTGWSNVMNGKWLVILDRPLRMNALVHELERSMRVRSLLKEGAV
jgi:hypothetical protein